MLCLRPFTNPVDLDNVCFYSNPFNDNFLIVLGLVIILKLQPPNALILALQDIAPFAFDELSCKPKPI